MTYLDEKQITEVGGILGAFMLIRKSVFKDVGFLDENFYLYCEDTDFCYRTRRAGWKVVYFPKVSVKHIHGGTTQSFRVRALVMFHRGIFYYYKKHHSKNNSMLMNAFVYTGILVRFSLSVGADILLASGSFAKALLENLKLLSKKIPSVVKFTVVEKSI
jgi:hypothetical protein